MGKTPFLMQWFNTIWSQEQIFKITVTERHKFSPNKNNETCFYYFLEIRGPVSQKHF